MAKGGARSATLLRQYKPNTTYHVKAILSTKLHRAYYYINGKFCTKRQFDTPVESICRVQFRTGSLFDKPDIETPADQFFDMPRADDVDSLAVFEIADFKTKSLDGSLRLTQGELSSPQVSEAAILKYDDYAHYAEHFNNMEDENIITDIPNSEASEWMRREIPLFDCPQENFREMYYYRWWSFRKHIENSAGLWDYGISGETQLCG